MASGRNNDGDPLAPHSLSPSELQELIAAERAGKPFLAFRGEGGSLALFELGPVGQIRTVGRRREMDLAIVWDSEVSGLHAELRGVGGEWTIVDDGLSTNGTFVNGQRINGRQRLRDEDRIRVGRTTLVYKAGDGATVESTVTAGDAPGVRDLTDTQRRVLVALCRPYRNGTAFATPATNQQIANEVFLGVDAVKMHLRRLFAKFELGDVPQNEKRVRLAEFVMHLGVVTNSDLV
jgi:hypothetical protein